MEILICVKEVPDDTIEIHLDKETMTPDLSKAANQANAFDTYALEMAVRYVEANGGRVTLVSAGKTDLTTTMRNCIAVGANAAYTVVDAGIEGADSSRTAGAVAAVIRKIEQDTGKKFDLILAGRESTDFIGGEFGGYLAETLGYPEVTNVVEFSADGDSITAKKELDSGYHMVRTTLPAVFTVSTPPYSPRYPTIKSKMAARKVEVPAYALSELGADISNNKVEFVSYIDPPKRTEGIKIGDLEPEDAAKKIMEMLIKDKAI